MRKDKRKIYIYDREGNLVKVARSKESAANFAKTSVASVIRSVNGNSKRSHCGYVFRYGDEIEVEEDTKSVGGLRARKSVVTKDGNGEIIKKYDSINSLARELGLHGSSLTYVLSGKMSKENFYKRHGVYVEYENNEEATKDEIIKPSREEYYINVLVGLVNRTLVDGATYNIRGMDYTYIKEQDMLTNEIGSIKREFYCELCEVKLPLLNEKEREFLKNILKAFSGIKSIKKCKHFYNGFEFIRLEASNEDNNIDLDYFKEGQYYNGLEIDRSYTLEELEIK